MAFLAYMSTGLSKYAAGPKYQLWTIDWATAALRVLKPGGLMFVMGHPRTFHRLACGVEDAGFEIIDVIQWVYWTGFPKAYDIGKGFDKKAGVKGKKIGVGHAGLTNAAGDFKFQGSTEFDLTTPLSELGQKWNGWKSAKGLKPAHEPILMVQKPKSENTICKNVEKWEVGGINVDATRIPFGDEIDNRIGTDAPAGGSKQSLFGDFANVRDKGIKMYKGDRFPANIIAESGVLGDKTRFVDIDAWVKQRFGLEYWKFIDVPKPHKKEKDAGLKEAGLELKKHERHPIFTDMKAANDHWEKTHPNLPERNNHPTVKPLKLFIYLISLGCPPGGVVLDPFVGSGTTCVAALKLGLKSIGIDKTPEYAAIAKARIQHAER